MNIDKCKKNLFFDTKEHHFNYFRKEAGINNKNFPIEFFSIVALMSEDCNFQIRTCYNDFSRLFIVGSYKSERCELLLRYGDGGRLVVAKVRFIHQRQGNMTELYKILRKIHRKHKTDKIVIECVQTDEMRAWCQKNKFVKEKGSEDYIEAK